jgi:hypothetical protein
MVVSLVLVGLPRTHCRPGVRPIGRPRREVRSALQRRPELHSAVGVRARAARAPTFAGLKRARPPRGARAGQASLDAAGDCGSVHPLRLAPEFSEHAFPGEFQLDLSQLEPAV